MKKALQYIAYLCVSACARAISLLPRRAVLVFAEGLGALIYHLDARHRRIALINLKIAFPDISPQRAAEIAKRSIQNLCRVVVELIYMPKIISQGRISEVLRLENDENHHIAARKNKAGIYITAHFGLWEYLFHGNWLLKQKFVPLHVVVRASGNPYIDEMVNRTRRMLGSVTVPKKQSIKHLLGALKKGEYLGILIDQNVCREEGVFVDFFGKKAATTFGATLLALRTDAPVVPVFVFRDTGRDTYKIRFLPDIPLVRTGDHEEDVRVNTQNFTACVERMVRECPENWLWIHKRWKTRPAGEEEKIY
ncbi:MAG TPA: lysophospholipid acyltransferase family protein [bacterium]|nr:lysophospholipid acyltransferase family protein [bacterium]